MYNPTFAPTSIAVLPGQIKNGKTTHSQLQPTRKLAVFVPEGTEGNGLMGKRLMEEVFKYIEPLGFRGMFLSGGQLHLLPIFRYEVHRKPFSDDWTDPRFVNTFVWV